MHNTRKYVLLSRKGNCKSPHSHAQAGKSRNALCTHLMPAERELSGFSEELKHRFAKPVAH